MSNKAIIQIVILLLLYSCKGKKSDAEKLNLTGKVEFITMKKNKVKVKYGGDIFPDTLIGWEIYLFDEPGSYKYREEWQFSKGELFSKRKKLYDKKGMLTDEFYFTARENEHFKREEIHPPLEGWSRADILNTLYKIDKYDYRYNFEYDKNGNRLYSIFYNYWGTEEARWRAKNDINGNMIEQKEYDLGDTLLRRIIYKYDNKNNMIERIVHNRGDSIHSKENWKYSRGGNLLEKIQIDYKPYFYKRYAYVYSDSGHKIEESEFNSSNVLQVKYNYRYVYDTKGNWILQIKYCKGKPVELVERNIKYYQ
jgi:hypothetical protein